MAPDLRLDPIGRRHVIVAPERAKRRAPVEVPEDPDPEPCDFCEGREGNTPPETYAARDEGPADTPGWRVRVVPNLYPATATHEVIVHTPDHHVRFEDLETDHRGLVLEAYAGRVRAADTAAVIVAHNRGRAAGASRSHDHGQLFGLERIPPTLEREMLALGERPCPLCKVTEEGTLAVTRVEGIKIFAHPVPLVADELLIVPECSPRFETLGKPDLRAFGEAMAEAITRIRKLHGDGIPFNLVIHTAPADVERFHWHAHLMPRTARWGALELGAELPIVAADPQETAARLREG